jgi:hypothetical protein
VELFNQTCDEARDWMLEKMTQLDTAELGPDLKTVQALQRRHQHLECELASMEEKVNRVNLLANSVKSSYPNERTNVTVHQKEVQDLWGKVTAKALEHRSRLEDAVGHQIFMKNSKNLVSNIFITAASVDIALSSREECDTISIDTSHDSPLYIYIYPTAFKLLALCCHIFHTMLFAAPPLSFCL